MRDNQKFCGYNFNHALWICITAWYMILKVSFKVHHTNPPGIGKIVLTRSRLNHMWSCICFSRHHHPRLEGSNTKEWECQLVNDYIENFINHRIEKVISLRETTCGWKLQLMVHLSKWLDQPWYTKRFSDGLQSRFWIKNKGYFLSKEHGDSEFEFGEG